jgi:hypothetical protein
MDELLKSIRNNIVERTANKATNEVHANNRFFIMAEQLGLGVQPKLPNDPYCGVIPDQQICAQLKESFDKHYQPFSILLQLKEMLTTPFDQYVGRKEEGYLVCTYGPGLEYIKNLFDEAEIDYAYLVTHEETGVVVDINWDLILGKLWDSCIENRYFEYSTWSSFFKYYHFNLISQFLKSQKEEKNQAAMVTVSQLFLNPNEDFSNEELENIPYLFTSAVECFAYFNCNPHLPDPVKVTLFARALNLMKDENLSDIDDAFWQFISENPALSDVFIRIYSEKYPHQLSIFEDSLRETPLYFHQLVEASSMQTLKMLYIKLKRVSTKTIEHIFQETNENLDNGLLCVVKKIKGHPEVMAAFMQFLSSMGSATLQHILGRSNWNGENILNVILSKGKEYPEVARQLINIVATLPPRDRDILQLRNPRVKVNALLVAIQHCPAVVPAILNMMLTLDEQTQNRITENCLQHHRVLHNACLIQLLELNQKANALGEQPSKKWVYQVAKKLQNELILSLDVYFLNQKNPNALPRLQKTWHETINRASVKLAELEDWSTLLLNLTLVLVSIPLLGIPLAIKYYCSGYKHVLFRPSVVEQLEHLDHSINEPPLCQAG